MEIYHIRVHRAPVVSHHSLILMSHAKWIHYDSTQRKLLFITIFQRTNEEKEKKRGDAIWRRWRPDGGMVWNMVHNGDGNVRRANPSHHFDSGFGPRPKLHSNEHEWETRTRWRRIRKTYYSVVFIISSFTCIPSRCQPRYQCCGIIWFLCVACP